MSRDVFDDAQLAVMGQAIIRIMGEGSNKSDARRKAVAHAVFTSASEAAEEFDIAYLVAMANEKLASRTAPKLPLVWN